MQTPGLNGLSRPQASAAGVRNVSNAAAPAPRTPAPATAGTVGLGPVALSRPQLPAGASALRLRSDAAARTVAPTDKPVRTEVQLADPAALPNGVRISASGLASASDGDRPLRAVQFDAATGRLAFWSVPGASDYRFSLAVQDGPEVTTQEVRLAVAAAAPNGPKVDLQSHYDVDLVEGAAELAIPVSVSDAGFPAERLAATAALQFTSADGETRTLIGRFSRDRAALLIENPGEPGMISARVRVENPDGEVAMASTMMRVRFPNAAPVVDVLPFRRTVQAGQGDAIVRFQVRDPDAEAGEVLAVSTRGVRVAADGTETEVPLQVKEEPNGTAVRIPVDQVGTYRVRVEAKDVRGGVAAGEAQVRAVDYAPQPKITQRELFVLGSGRKTLPLPVVDPDHAAAELDVKVTGVFERTASGTTPVSNVASVRRADDGFALDFQAPWSMTPKTYDVHVTVTDPDGNETEEVVQVFYFRNNERPTVKLQTRAPIWKSGGAARTVPVSLTDELLDKARITFEGTFTPAGSSEAVPFEVRTDANHNILFDPSGAEAAVGTYHIRAAVQDVHGEQAADEVTIQVAEEIHPPVLELQDAYRIDAPDRPAVHRIEATVRDTDTPLEHLDIQVTANSRVADGRGTLRPTPVQAVTHVGGNGKLFIDVPVSALRHSETELQVTLRDTSEHEVVASTRLTAAPRAQAPVLNVGQEDRHVAVADHPVMLPIEAFDPNGDVLTFDVKASFQGADGRRTDVPAEVVYMDGNRFLRLTPSTEGTYSVSITAQEARGSRLSTTATMEITAKPADRLFMRTPIYAGGDNRFSSENRMEMVELTGIAPDARELRANNIRVQGVAPFQPGHEADDIHTTSTHTHDSFAQAVAFQSIDQLRKAWESANLGMSWAELVGAKTGKEEVTLHVNGIADLNAYYSPRDEEMRFGTASGKWSLGADPDVVIHEAGHWLLDHLAPDLSYWGHSGAMHEAYGDAQAAFLLRDPEISEDFSVVRNQGGAGLRNVNNDLTTRETGWEVHDLGRVYGGMTWSIGEYLHREITGRPRREGMDQEKLDPTAAEVGLKLLWTYPLHLGGKSPGAVDFVRSLVSAVDDLADGGHLPARVNPSRLKNFILMEGVRRGLLENPGDRGLVDDGRALLAQGVSTPEHLAGDKTLEEVVNETLTKAGFDPADVRVEAFGSLRTPGGHQVHRYQVVRDVRLGDGLHRAVVDDDYLSILVRRNGTYEVQWGRLADTAQAQVSDPRLVTFANAGALTFDGGALKDQLRTEAQARLSRRVRALRDDTPRAMFTRGAYEQLVNKGDDFELRWVDGKLTAWLMLNTEAYYGEVTADGQVINVKRQALLIEG